MNSISTSVCPGPVLLAAVALKKESQISLAAYVLVGGKESSVKSTLQNVSQARVQMAVLVLTQASLISTRANVCQDGLVGIAKSTWMNAIVPHARSRWTALTTWTRGPVKCARSQYECTISASVLVLDFAIALM